MTTPALDQALAHAVGSANVADAGQLPLYAVDGVVPKAVVFASTREQVAEVMRLAAAEGLAVTPWGGGSAMALGNTPQRLDVVLGTMRMSRIVEHESADMTATVEAGITLESLNDALALHGQHLPFDAPLAERATIGGILAANASGPRRLAFGTPRDRVIGIRVVDAQGVLVKGGGKVVKNVAGYDMNKLFIGSLGSLGVIVEATFKLAPLPRARATMVGGFSRLEEAMTAAQALLATGSPLLALELLNGTAYELVSARAGTPAMADRAYFLAVDLGGSPGAVQRQKVQAHQAFVEAGGKSLAVEDDSPYRALWRAIIDLGHREELPATMLTKTSALFTDVSRLVPGHEALAEGGKLEVAIDVHLPAGVIRASWWGEKKGAADEAMLLENAATLRKATANAGGSLVIESCPPAMKRRMDVWGREGADLAIMRRMKEKLDPGRILSPGRFVVGL